MTDDELRAIGNRWDAVKGGYKRMSFEEAHKDMSQVLGELGRTREALSVEGMVKREFNNALPAIIAGQDIAEVTLGGDAAIALFWRAGSIWLRDDGEEFCVPFARCGATDALKTIAKQWESGMIRWLLPGGRVDASALRER